MAFTNTWDEGARPAGGDHPSTIDTETQKNWKALRERIADTAAGTSDAEHRGYVNAASWTGCYHKEGTGRIFVGTNTARAALALGDTESTSGVVIRAGHVWYCTDTLKTWIMGATIWIQTGSWAPTDRAQAMIYSTGTVTMTANSAVITGSGTDWTTANGVIANAIFGINESDGEARWYRISSVDSATQVTLTTVAVTTGATRTYTVTSMHGEAIAYRETTRAFTGYQRFLPNYAGACAQFLGNVDVTALKTIDGVDISEHTHSGAGQGGTVAYGSLSGAPAETVWDSGWFAVAANTSYNKTHDLGALPKFATVWFSANADGSNARLAGYIVWTGAWVGTTLNTVTTTTCRVITGITYVSSYASSDGTENFASGYCRVLLKI